MLHQKRQSILGDLMCLNVSVSDVSLLLGVPVAHILLPLFGRARSLATP